MRYSIPVLLQILLPLNPLQYHTRRNNFNFDTLQGKSITKGLLALAKKFDLSALFGTAPQDYTISQFVLPVITARVGC